MSRIVKEWKGKDYLVEGNTFWESPLHLACKSGNIDIIKILFGYDDKVASISVYNRKIQMKMQNKVFGNAPLHLAALFGYDEIVMLLLELDNEKQLVKMHNRLKNTPVHFAARKGNLK